jgi:hypothetical protein
MYGFFSHTGMDCTSAVLVLSKGWHANFFSPQIANPQILGLIPLIANMQITEVCQFENRKSANL